VPACPEPPAAAGLLLLTGGRGRRFGGPKHLQPHPDGGTWGSHLVDVFGAVFPGGPVQLLGAALPGRPDLVPEPDPGEGPAVALRLWAGRGGPQPRRWWLAACDQVRWTAESLDAWHAAVAAADPSAAHWVVARNGGRIQPLGGFLAGGLVAALARVPARALMGLVDALPALVLDSEGGQWLDVDTREAHRAYLEGLPEPPRGRP